MCFRRLFSSCNSLSCLTCPPSIPVYFFFQLYTVALEIPFSRQRSSIERPPSYCLMIERILLSVKFFFFIIEQFKITKLSKTSLSDFSGRLQLHKLKI